MAGFDNGSQIELAAMAAALTTGVLAGIWCARRRVPAVSVGLGAGLVSGIIAFFISSADGPHGVPQTVVVWASAGLIVFGLLAVCLLPSPEPMQSWRPLAIGLAVSAPAFALLTVLSVQHACPLYVTRGSGFCYYTDDVLGGWSAGAAIALGFDLLFVGFLVAASALRANRSRSDVAAAVRAPIAAN